MKTAIFSGERNFMKSHAAVFIKSNVKIVSVVEGHHDAFGTELMEVTISAGKQIVKRVGRDFEQVVVEYGGSQDNAYGGYIVK